MGRSYEDDDCEEGSPDALSGYVSGTNDPSVLADLLLELLASCAQLTVLLNEASEEEKDAVLPRLNALRAMFGLKPLPPSGKAKPKDKQPIGFRSRKSSRNA